VNHPGQRDIWDMSIDRVDHQDYGLPAGAADGHEGFKRVLGVFCDAFPDLKLTIDFIVADREKLVANVTTEGTHQGPFMGAPATGKRFKVKGTDIFAFNDAGLVSEHWGAFNALGMMMQLGIIPAPQTQQAAQAAVALGYLLAVQGLRQEVASHPPLPRRCAAALIGCRRPDFLAGISVQR
jgi:predicted ester cyclase